MLITKLMNFENNDLNRIGCMRGDFAPDYNKSSKLCNKWFWNNKNALTESVCNNKELIKEIQDVCNQILFEDIKSFDNLLNLCNPPTFDTGETNYFYQSESFNYCIRLNPMIENYNILIYVYKK